MAIGMAGLVLLVCHATWSVNSNFSFKGLSTKVASLWAASLTDFLIISEFLGSTTKKANVIPATAAKPAAMPNVSLASS